MREEIERILDSFEGISREALVNALVMFVEHERFDAKHEGAMYALDRVRDAFTGGSSEDRSDRR